MVYQQMVAATSNWYNNIQWQQQNIAAFQQFQLARQANIKIKFKLFGKI
jgi:hypothetical protein